MHRDYLAFGNEKEIPFELLYNIKNDPSEKNNLVLKRKDILKKMRKIYFNRDFHHPEKTVISFFPSSSEKKIIDVDVSCQSPFIGYGLFDTNIKFIKDNLRRVKSEKGMHFSFTLAEKPLYFIFENDDDRAPVRIFIKENGRLISPYNIYTTNLNTNISGNPVILENKIDFILLNDTQLPVKEDFFNKSKELRVKIVRIDLHRWIDIGKFEATAYQRRHERDTQGMGIYTIGSCKVSYFFLKKSLQEKLNLSALSIKNIMLFSLTCSRSSGG